MTKIGYKIIKYKANKTKVKFRIEKCIPLMNKAKLKNKY